MKYLVTLLIVLTFNSAWAIEKSTQEQPKPIKEDKCLKLGEKVVFENKKLTKQESTYWENVCNKTKRDPKDK